MLIGRDGRQRAEGGTRPERRSRSKPLTGRKRQSSITENPSPLKGGPFTLFEQLCALLDVVSRETFVRPLDARVRPPCGEPFPIGSIRPQSPGRGDAGETRSGSPRNFQRTAGGEAAGRDWRYPAGHREAKRDRAVRGRLADSREAGRGRVRASAFGGLPGDGAGSGRFDPAPQALRRVPPGRACQREIRRIRSDVARRRKRRFAQTTQSLARVRRGRMGIAPLAAKEHAPRSKRVPLCRKLKIVALPLVSRVPRAKRMLLSEPPGTVRIRLEHAEKPSARKRRSRRDKPVGAGGETHGPHRCSGRTDPAALLRPRCPALTRRGSRPPRLS